MHHFVYVLFSSRDRQFYIGYTANLTRRLKEHHQGKNTSTRARTPLKLIYYEAHLSKVDAQRREKYFKTSKGKTTLRQMVRHGLEMMKQ
jgi:putative endonuclease